MQAHHPNSTHILAAIAAFALLMAGCATPPFDNTPVLLRATGDLGVTVRVASTQPGVPERVVTVPAELTFYGESFDLTCVHGPQPGRLALVASRGGVSISTGDTTQAGQVTQIQIRRGSIAIGVPGDISGHK